MKKTVTKPDGSTEVIEGTAEEIAAYERKLREEGKKPKKDGILKGSGTPSLDGLELSPTEVMWIRWLRTPQYTPVVTQSCWRCGHSWCTGTCTIDLSPVILCGESVTDITTPSLIQGCFLGDGAVLG